MVAVKIKWINIVKVFRRAKGLELVLYKCVCVNRIIIIIILVIIITDSCLLMKGEAVLKDHDRKEVNE